MDNGWQHFWILLRILCGNGIIHLEKVNTGFDILNISMNYATIIFSHVNFLLILPAALIQNAYLIKLGVIVHLETITFDIWNNDGNCRTFNWRQTLESDCKFLLYNTWVNSSSYIDIEVFISIWCTFSSIHLLSTHCTVQYQI